MWILVRARLSALIHTPTWVHMHTSSPELAPQESAVSLLSFCHLRTLAEVADILEPRGLQEEAEVPAQILAEFVTVCARWEPVCQKPGTAPGSFY